MSDPPAQAPPIVGRPIRRWERTASVPPQDAVERCAGWWGVVPRHPATDLLMIMGMWALLLLLVPPSHEFPVIDDWNHANAVRNMLQAGKFDMPPTMQANLLGLVAWGASWSRLFGFSFTTLTYSTLALELAGLVAFYGLARSLGVPRSGGLLGTALLAY